MLEKMNSLASTFVFTGYATSTGSFVLNRAMQISKKRASEWASRRAGERALVKAANNLS